LPEGQILALEGLDRNLYASKMVERYGPEEKDRAHDYRRSPSAAEGRSRCPDGRTGAYHIIYQGNSLPSEVRVKLRPETVLGREETARTNRADWFTKVEIDTERRGERVCEKRSAEQRATDGFDTIRAKAIG
jgi:hypothetical protein